MSFTVAEHLPDYEEIFKSSGVQGIIDGLQTAYGLEGTDVFEIFVTDPDPILQGMIQTNPDLNMFLSTPMVLDLLKNQGWGPGEKEAFLALPGAPDAFTLDFFMNWVGSSLLPVPPNVKAAAAASGGVLRASAGLLNNLASKTAPNSRLGTTLRTLSAGLVAASEHSNAAIMGIGLIGGLASTQIWDGIQAIYTMWYGLSTQQQQEAPETLKQALKVAERIEQILKNAEIKDKDMDMVAKLGKTLAAGGMSNIARQMISQEYELHALSVLKRQLQNVFNERTPLYEFSSMALKSRATRPAGNHPSLAGPASVIGIH